MKKIILLFIVALLPITVAANESTGPVNVTNMTNWVGTTNNPNESLLVQTSGNSFVNPASCARSDYYHFPAASQISKSMLLSALAANLNVSLVIYGGGCASDNRPVIVAVALVAS